MTTEERQVERPAPAKAKSPVGPVIILVDNRVRDLGVAALIAHHLGRLGTECRLEPLEAFRAVLAADRPSMVVFNHLNAGHLVNWSKRLAKLGVLTAVLPNEGIAYEPDVLRYLAGRYHNGAHIDYFFCWNEAHREALRGQEFGSATHIEVTGVPRFDYYFEPWSRLSRRVARESRKPRILFCTNFLTAKYLSLPAVHADRLFSQWADRIPLYKDYWSAIHAHARARERSLDYLLILAESSRYEITLRPHPGEDANFYDQWLRTLPPAVRGNIRLDPKGDIHALILDCDLEISCETCTTALESWIAGKPTIELIFERHPMWYREVQARGNIECADPSLLPSLVDKVLSGPPDPDKTRIRREHVATWCASPDGTSALRLAEIIVDAVREKTPADWSLLTANDRRRALKLRMTRLFGLAYHFDPLLWLKRLLFRGRYAMKDATYRKSIKPEDVRAAIDRIEAVMAESGQARG